MIERAGSDVALPGERGSILVVDDELLMVRTYERVLAGAGYAVQKATDGVAAQELIARHRFDVILSDVAMPGMSGLELLQAARRHDVDVPVILVTGAPSVSDAIRAVEHGALLYLVKPIDARALLQITEYSVRIHRMAKLRREASAHLGALDRQLGDRVALEASFERAHTSLWIAFQPIVRWSRREVIGYEALLRSGEVLLPSPHALLDAAVRLGRVHDLGRAIRGRIAAAIPSAPPSADIFVNLHVVDLDDPELLVPASPLSRFARRVVLEVTESAPLEQARSLSATVSSLRELGYRLALDDFGAGYAGLNAFALLKPNVVKLDMALTRNIHRDPVRRKVVAAMTGLCRDLDMLVIAEGVELAEERDTLVEFGCDTLQGYLFGRPSTAFADAAW